MKLRYIIFIIIMLFAVSCGGKGSGNVLIGSDVGGLENFDDLPFTAAYLSEGNSFGLEYVAQPLTWGDEQNNFIAYYEIFRQKFDDAGENPQYIPRDAEIVIGFGDYPPSSCTLIRDTNTYLKGGQGGHDGENTAYTVNRSSGTSLVFNIDYGGESVVYYTLTAVWQNGNTVVVSFAASPVQE